MSQAGNQREPRREEKWCPCGRVVPDTRRGVWSGLANYVLIPLFTFLLYLLAVLAGLKLSPDSPALGVVVLNLPVLSLLITTGVQVARGHRGGCLMVRAFGWWLWWPGGTVTALAFG